ncbi:MAG: hypothetical protein QME66_13495 [Candidatus Eisenbacteria bacterium]|nr:hypothetical protein [Candidatus Eisenbacteria bacterium]
MIQSAGIAATTAAKGLDVPLHSVVILSGDNELDVARNGRDLRQAGLVLIPFDGR